jgi:DNA-directed RNA polymerase specialized sigma24 family protein
MGLWLERRDEKGNLIDRAPCTDGHFIFPVEEGQEALVLSVKQAQELARHSNGLPPEKRDWVLRVDFGD